MKIKKAIETENGTVTFEGELSQEELDFVIETGLRTLLVNGAIKMMMAPEAEEDTPKVLN